MSNLANIMLNFYIFGALILIAIILLAILAKKSK